jgi:1,4-dihydroxy-6-naphthoate synthase
VANWPFRDARPPPTCCCGWPRRSSARSSSCATTRSSARSSTATYRDHGLVEIADLGAWWEAETGLPIPLAGICARSDLDEDVAAEAERAIRASVEHAFAHPEDSRDYVRAHAQELSEDVCRSHIELYVNAYSVDLGDEGLDAIAALTGRASLVR